MLRIYGRGSKANRALGTPEFLSDDCCHANAAMVQQT